MADYDSILLPPEWMSDQPPPEVVPPPVAAPPPALAADLNAGPAPAPADAPWYPAEWVEPQFAGGPPPGAGMPPPPEEGPPRPGGEPLNMAPLDLRPPDAGGAPVVAAPPPPLDGPAPASGAPDQFETAVAQPGSAADERPTMDFTPEEAQDADVERLLAAGPEKVAAEDAQRQARAADYQATRFLEADTRNRQQAEKNALDWRTKEAEFDVERKSIRADMQALQKDGVHNDHWYASRTTGQKIAAWVAALQGGLASLKNGGRNQGMEFIQHEIDRDIETQKANLQMRGQVLGQRQGMLAQLSAHNGDVLRSEETLRQAAWANVDQRLAAQAAKLDPAGAAANRIAGARLDVQAKLKTAAVAAEQRLWDRKKDQFDMGMRRSQLAVSQGQLAETRRSREATLAETRHGRDAEMLQKGFVPDATAPGGYKFDPKVLPAGPTKPQDILAMDRDARIKQETAMADDARKVQFRGKAIGTTLTPKDGEELRDSVQAYEKYQTEITELAGMLSNPDGSPKTFYQGPGWAMHRNPERDAIRAKALNVLYLQAKVNDPSTGVRDSEIKFGEQIVPFVQGLTSGVTPAAQADAIRKQSDTDMLSRFNSKLVGGVESIPTGQNPVEVWRKTRDAVAASRDAANQAATPEQQKTLLTAKIADGTPPEAREGFVQSKIATMQRWVNDNPKMFEGLDAAKTKATWQNDKSLTVGEKKQLDDAFDNAVKSAYGHYAVGDYGLSVDLNEFPEFPEDED